MKSVNICFCIIVPILFSVISNGGGGGGTQREVWLGAQTLTLFKTEIFDFPTLFKTVSRIVRSRLNTFSQQTLRGQPLGSSCSVQTQGTRVIQHVLSSQGTGRKFVVV